MTQRRYPNSLTENDFGSIDQVFRVELTSFLLPGQTATAKPLYWDPNTSEWAMADEPEITIRDWSGRNAGHIGTRYKVRREPDVQRFEITESCATSHWKGKLDAELTQGGTASVSLWYFDDDPEVDELVDSGQNVTAREWMFTVESESIGSGTWVKVELHADGKWWVTAAGCQPEA